MRLFLVRHAQTEWNVKGLAQGHTDIELDDIGKKQSHALKVAFQNREIKKIYSSDLKRCLQTAEGIAEVCQAELIIEPLLRERQFGEWEGLAFDELLRRRREMERQGVDPYEHTPPGGEAMRDVWNRIIPVVDQLTVDSQPICVVTHGGTLSLLLSQLLNGGIETARSFSFGNTAVTELNRHPDGHYRLISFNDTSHLEDLKSIHGSLDGTHR